ncbi:hypothetical protein [Ruegeria arenilitoris]|uniref:hypothetical protein n=1 Tax=Ruegeria arenilitoris TaxID=1173585 RepID=UPI00147C0EA7|nr:hypothetical protein [Ruegeria arenilitoris]
MAQSITKQEYFAMDESDREVARIISLEAALKERSRVRRVSSSASQDPQKHADRKRLEIAKRREMLNLLNRVKRQHGLVRKHHLKMTNEQRDFSSGTFEVKSHHAPGGREVVHFDVVMIGGRRVPVKVKNARFTKSAILKTWATSVSSGNETHGSRIKLSWAGPAENRLRLGAKGKHTSPVNKLDRLTGQVVSGRGYVSLKLGGIDKHYRKNRPVGSRFGSKIVQSKFVD